MSRNYCVYILASRSRNLYIGVTNDLQSRTLQHRQKQSEFTARYRIFRLVHFEEFGHIRDAIAREKEIKAWRRQKKIRLIESRNPTWADLAQQLPAKHQKADPSHRSPKSGDRVRDDNSSAAPTTKSPTLKPVIPNPAPSGVIPNPASSKTALALDAGRTTSDPDSREGSAFSSPSARKK